MYTLEVSGLSGQVCLRTRLALILAVLVGNTSGTGFSHTLPIDPGQPTLLGAKAGAELDQVLLCFAVGDSAGQLEPSSATTASHYTLSGGLLVSRAQLSCSGTNVILTTSRQTESASYTVTVNGVADLLGSFVPPNSQASFRANALIRGLLRNDVFWNLPGSSLGDLTNHANYPICPDATALVTAFEAPRNVGDDYGQILSGLLLPPLTGGYRFWIASADQSTLFLSTDESAANKLPIASQVDWTTPRAWSCLSQPDCQNSSALIQLEGGRRYYVEAVMTAGSYADHIAVAWQLPGGALPRDGADVIPGTYLATHAQPATQLTVTTNPLNVTAVQGCRALFTAAAVVVPAGAPVTYQWQRNSADIAGANSPTYLSSELAASDNFTVYRCFVRAPGLSKATANAILTVSEDVAPPTLAGAVSLSPTQVLLFFSETVTPLIPARFVMSDRCVISSAAVSSADPAVVELTIHPSTPMKPGRRYELVAAQLTDASGNSLHPDPTSVSFTAQPAWVPTVSADLRLTPAGSLAVIEWFGDGVLQATDAVDKPWEDLPDAFSPYVFAATPSSCAGQAAGTRKFYRVRLAAF
jgi:hypothetical protein